MLVFQLGSAALVVKTLGMCGFLEVDDLNPTNVKSFSIVALIFTSSLFCNMHALKNVNVEVSCAGSDSYNYSLVSVVNPTANV